MKKHIKYQISFWLVAISFVCMFWFSHYTIIFIISCISATVFITLCFKYRYIRCRECDNKIYQYWQDFKYCPYCGEKLI